MAAKHVLERETFGKKLSDRQSVQFMLADCAAEIYKARLMLMHIAYKAENGLDMTQENSIAKYFLPIWFIRSWIPRFSFMDRLGILVTRPWRIGTRRSEVSVWSTGPMKFIAGK